MNTLLHVETMRAVVLDRSGAPEVRRVPRPQPRAGELHVRISAVGLCGSDVEKLGDVRASGAVLGHEIAGVVLAGPLPPGTRVAVAHRVPCGECERCLAGNETTCLQYLASGLRPGGFAEELVASARHVDATVLALPDAIDDVEATMIEPLACILRALEAVPRGRGVVVGCGAIGLLAARALRARGDGVLVADPDPQRLLAALEETDGLATEGVDLDFAFVTAPAGIDAALALLRPGGTCLVFAAPDAPSSIPLDTIYRRELVLIGRRSATPAALRSARAAIAEGRVPVSDLVTAVLPLEQFDDGVQRYRSRAALKVVFRP